MQVFMMSLMGAMGGLFWGYFQSHYNTTSDIYVIMMDIEEDKQSTFNGVTTGMIQLGGIFGAVLSSQLVNRLSRRKAFLLIDMLSLLGVGIHCIKSVPLLFIGNFIGGMSMGLNSTFIGTYISEVSPI
jgi:MFS family permease